MGIYNRYIDDVTKIGRSTMVLGFLASLLPAGGLGAMLGSFAFFNVGNLMKFNTNPDVTVAAISGMIIMVVCLKIGEKMAWLKEWALTFAMFGGAAIGLLAA